MLAFCFNTIFSGKIDNGFSSVVMGGGGADADAAAAGEIK